MYDCLNKLESIVTINNDSHHMEVPKAFFTKVSHKAHSNSLLFTFAIAF